MNRASQKLGEFVRDLLEQPENIVVFIGRRDFVRDNFDALQIVIDNVDASTRIATTSTYDGVNEKMTRVQKISAPCTVDFYGLTAYEEAERFVLLLGGQKSYELQRDGRTTVYQESDIIDLRLLTGDQYSGRVQVSLSVQFNMVLVEDVLRIDELQSTLIESN